MGLPPGRHSSDSVDRAALARTCRTFREPVLDVLREVLYDLSPLARCIPEACSLAEPAGKQSYWWDNVVCIDFIVT